MPMYRIRGAHRDTAKPADATILANDETEAEAIANHRGIMMSRITELEEPAASPPRPSPRPA